MENREDNLFGRKVFFLNPTMMVENVVVERLRQMEYEVYIIRDFRDAKPVLSEYENSICFINIDDQLSYKEWFNFVKSFEFDSSLESIFLGVLSAKAKIDVKEQFVMKAKLPGGFVNTSEHQEIVINTIEKILDLNSAKGRRRYIRLDCENMTTVKASILLANRMIDFKIMDLSVAGFAAQVNPALAPVFQKGMKLNNITATMGVRTTVIQAEIFAVKNDGQRCTIVFLLSQDTNIKLLEEIRKFIHKTLQQKMDDLIDTAIKDLTDYSKEIVPPVSETAMEASSVNNSLDDLKFEELGDLEDFDVGLDG